MLGNADFDQHRKARLGLGRFHHLLFLEGSWGGLYNDFRKKKRKKKKRFVFSILGISAAFLPVICPGKEEQWKFS